MGESWRIGVHESERTDLVTKGPFGLVRNPIFTAMLVTGAGIALVVPNFIAVAGWMLLLIATELQVRVSKSPTCDATTATPTAITWPASADPSRPSTYRPTAARVTSRVPPSREPAAWATIPARPPKSSAALRQSPP